jgi:hypothetical protein
MRPSLRITLAAAALAGLCLALGCRGPCAKGRPRVNYYLSSRQELQRVPRVVFVELYEDQGYPKVARDMTDALFKAVQARNLFHLDLVSAADPACRDLPLDGSDGLTMEQLAQIRQALHCDAVLTGKMSHFRPHPRMQIALYLRLLNLRDGKLIWGVGDTWDSTDLQTEGRIREYYDQQVGTGYDPAQWRLVRMSPLMFEKFVAQEVACTLDAPAPPAEPVDTSSVSQNVLKLQRKASRIKMTDPLWSD